MKKWQFYTCAVSFVFFTLTLTTAWAADPTVTQSFSLRPGWNAVYLEVEPIAPAPVDVFKELPAGSTVWAWTGKHDPVQFIQDPNEPTIRTPKWLSVFTSAGQTALTSLYAVKAQSPFLVMIPASSPPVALNILGKPSLRHKGWIPDSFNLTGFGFKSTPPDFASFFAPSIAHKNQTIYRLNNSSGTWVIVDNPASTPMVSGEAFWSYCQSGSDYQGPLAVEAGYAASLDFGTGITMLKLTVTNQSAIDRTVSVAQVSAVSPVPLGYRIFDAASVTVKTMPLKDMSPFIVKAGASTVLTLVVLRGDFTGAAASVLEFSDNLGSLVRVPVTATSQRASTYPGLWSANATITRVSQLTESGPTPEFLPGPARATPSPLSMNLILHQDRNSKVRLLKQAILMAKDPDAQTGTPGRFVILSDDKLIPNFSGVSQRDGTRIGRRMSSVAIDYSPRLDSQYGTEFNDSAANCTGTISNSVVCEIILQSSSSGTHTTNPFLHRFHPDHDNLGPDFKAFSKEVNQIRRHITFSFDKTPQPNPDNPPPGWDVTVLGGTYTELVYGLSRGPVRVEGTFTFRRTSEVDVINE